MLYEVITEPFSSVLEKNLSRRTVVRGGMFSAMALLSGLTLTGCNSDDNNDSNDEVLESIALAFESIAASRNNFV